MYAHAGRQKMHAERQLLKPRNLAGMHVHMEMPIC